MLALKIIAGIAAVLLLIAMIPIRIRIKYDEKLTVFVPILFLHIYLYPQRGKLTFFSKNKYEKLISEEKNLSKKRKKKSKKIGKDTHFASEKRKLSLAEIASLVKEIFSAAGKILEHFNKYLRVKIYALKAVISSDDAAKTAITYGAVSGTLGTLVGILEDRCHIKYAKNAETDIICDYIAGSCSAECDIRFSVRIWQAIKLLFIALINFIKIKSKTEVKNNVGNQDK